MAPYTWQDGNLWGVLNDDLRVRVGLAEGTGGLWISVDARMWDDRETMANFSHDDHNTYALEEITVSDDGCLTALHRQSTASGIDFRTGFTLRVPQAFVEPLRTAIKAASEA